MEVQDEKETSEISESDDSGTTDSDTDPVEQLAAVYRDYPGLRALIRRRVQNPELAADILQDAAVTTLEKLRAGKIAQPSGIGGYLYKVALNHLNNYRRKDRAALSSSAELESLPDGDDSTLVAGTDRAGLAKATLSMLKELPSTRDQELLVRFYLKEERKESICSSLGLSDEHFYRVLFRARKRLRALLERCGYQKHDLFALALLGVSLYTIYPAISFLPFAARMT